MFSRKEKRKEKEKRNKRGRKRLGLCVSVCAIYLLVWSLDQENAMKGLEGKIWEKKTSL